MKQYNVIATLGRYQNKEGETKYRNKVVGAVYQTKDGFLKMKMDACFNPAGLHKSEDGGVWLTLFEPKEQQQNNDIVAQMTEFDGVVNWD